MKNLLVCAPQLDDVTSFWRCAGPLNALKHPGWNIMYVPDRHRFDWTDISQVDAIFMQRPSTDQHVHLLDMAKAMNRKVWVEYDDDLTSIPYSNDANPFYNQTQIQKNLSHIAKHASVVSVTTERLKQRMQNQGAQDVRVIPNAWNDNLFPFYDIDKKRFNYLKASKVSKAHAKKFIMWRGSKSHNEDLDTHLGELRKIHDNHKDYHFLFVGHFSYRVREVIDKERLMWLDPMSIVNYHGFLKDMTIEATFVPLVDNTFNRCKSNIAWQEATYNGSSCVAPDFEEWRFNGCGLYDPEKKNLAEVFGNVLESRDQMQKDSIESIMEHRLLSKVNNLRKEILDGLA